MIPLVFAAALGLSGPIQHPLDAPAPSAVTKDLPSAPLGSYVAPPPVFKNLQRDLMGKPVLCDRSTIQTLGPNGSALKKLGDLPPGLLEHAVVRIVNGCPVREIVYAGQTYYLDASPGGLERDLRGSRMRRY
jgi:hypothetical protein